MPSAAGTAAPPIIASELPAGHDAPAGHLHLWRLPDGTGLHAPPGTLTVDPETGQLCCHLCGRWFRFLGGHVRVHGHTAASYRAEIGLCRGQALMDAGISASISERQRLRYQQNPTLRQWFAVGQNMARRGELGRISRQARAESPVPAAIARQAAARAAGRETRRKRRQARLNALVERSHSDLGTMLRSRYAAGASLATLARETGLGRAKLREALIAAGVQLRPQGQNTDDGRRSRARTAEVLAARQVGTDDLTAWLQSRRASGWTLDRLGDALGHSGHWVKWRLEPAPHHDDPGYNDQSAR